MSRADTDALNLALAHSGADPPCFDRKLAFFRRCDRCYLFMMLDQLDNMKHLLHVHCHCVTVTDTCRCCFQIAQVSRTSSQADDLYLDDTGSGGYYPEDDDDFNSGSGSGKLRAPPHTPCMSHTADEHPEVDVCGPAFNFLYFFI